MSVYNGDELKKLNDLLDNMLQEFPKAKQDLVNKAGNIMEQKVRENLSKHKDTGETLSAVTKATGSGGGYVAVRNDYNKCKTAHLLENGYIPKSRGKSKNKKKKQTATKVVKSNEKPFITGQAYVPGHHCYRNALLATQDEIIAESEKMAKKLVGDTFG